MPEQSQQQQQQRNAARIALSWCVLLSALGAIYWVSDRAIHVPAGPRIPHLDKILHFGAYGVLGLLWLWALREALPKLRLTSLALLAGALGAAYGASDEWHQSFVPGRSADVWDWVADATGALTATLVVAWWVSRRA